MTHMHQSLERTLSWQMALQTALTLLVVCTVVWLGIDRLFERQHCKRPAKSS
jgi:hypothetical protein